MPLFHRTTPRRSDSRYSPPMWSTVRGTKGNLDEGIQPLREHLALELLSVERYLAGVAMVISGIGVFIALFITFTADKALGLGILGLTSAAFAWFALARTLLSGGIGGRVFSVMSPLVEISFPTAIIWIDLVVQNPRYAATMSPPLQLYGALVILQVVRLQRWMPIIMATVGALQYLTMMLFVVRPRLAPDIAALPEYDTPLVIVRGFLVVLAGIMASAVGLAVRGAVRRAAKSARAQDLFGRYRILERIAEGGMGSIHRALYCPEGGFARPVALKRIHDHLARQDAFVDSFRAEAEISSRLVHANIVQVLDFGRVENTYFLAMEFVDGSNLSQVLQAAAATHAVMPEPVLARIGAELLEGLHFAQEVARDAEGKVMRVLHRDLSPSNVLVSKTGEVRIADFGLARPLGESGALLTAHVAGKSSYMSPEQTRGEAMDMRSDLFAAAIILWECVTLRPLFWRGNNVASGIAVAYEDAPAPSTVLPVPSAWDAFFATALAKDPSVRFQNARDMQSAWRRTVGDPGRAEDLATYMARLPIKASAPEPGDRLATELTHREKSRTHVEHG